MNAITFAYREGVLATTGKQYRITKKGAGEYDIALDLSLKGTPEVAQLLRQASDEITKDHKNGDKGFSHRASGNRRR